MDKNQQMQNGVPPYVSAHEAAALLGVNIKTIYAAIKDGTMPSLRVGRTVRIPAAAFQGVQGNKKG
jgi:excisionase family DNA binding protein